MQVKEFKLDNKIFHFREKLRNLIETSVVQAELKGLKFNL